MSYQVKLRTGVLTLDNGKWDGADLRAARKANITQPQTSDGYDPHPGWTEAIRVADLLGGLVLQSQPDAATAGPPGAVY